MNTKKRNKVLEEMATRAEELGFPDVAEMLRDPYYWEPKRLMRMFISQKSYS